MSIEMVKSLRQRTGAGVGDCKKALEEAGGNEEKAIEIIQKKGLAKVAKKAGAIAAEGLVHSYIHAGSKIGVLLEVNCQTDFVARNEDFKAFVDQLAMHIASEKPEYVLGSEITDSVVEKQRGIFVGQLEEGSETNGQVQAASGHRRESLMADWPSGRKKPCSLTRFFFSLTRRRP